MVDIQKEVTCSLIEVKKERKSPIVSLDVPNFLTSTKTTKDNNQNSVDALTNLRGIRSTPFVKTFGPWISDDVILTLHDGLMQPYFTKNSFSLLEQVT